MFNDKASTEQQRQDIYKQLEKFLSLTLIEYGYTDIYLTDGKGKVIYAVKMKDNLQNADLSSRDYVSASLKGNQNWSDLFYSDVINNNMMALSTPIYDDVQASVPIGTINILIDQTKINEIVHSGIEEIGETGDSYIVNESGLLLTETKMGKYAKEASLKETIETEATKLLSNEIKNKNSEYLYTGKYKDYNGSSVFGSISVVDFGDKYAGLIIEVDESEAFQHINSLKKVIIIFTGISIFAAIAIALLLSKTITNPLAAVVKYAKEIANYNISNDVPKKYIDRKDEIGEISNAVQEVEENLRDVLKKIGNSSEQVAASSEELTATSQQFATALEDVAQTINEIANGASEQAQSTTEGAGKLNELGNLIEEDRELMDILNESSKKVVVLVKEGMESVKDLSIKTKENKSAADIVYTSIIKTNESSNKIGEASSLISSIAEQTNLLALNAAIESARAGEHGRGFAVVAEEIRKLAEQSTISTKVIDQIVKTLKDDASKAVEVIKEMDKIAKEQMESVQVTEEKYREIAIATEKSEEAVQVLNESAIKMEMRKNELYDNVQTLSAVAEQNAASTQETSASIQEQTSSMEEISNSSEGLSLLAQDLQQLIKRFTV